VMRILMIFGEL